MIIPPCRQTESTIAVRNENPHVRSSRHLADRFIPWHPLTIHVRPSLDRFAYLVARREPYCFFFSPEWHLGLVSEDDQRRGSGGTPPEVGMTTNSPRIGLPMDALLLTTACLKKQKEPAPCGCCRSLAIASPIRFHAVKGECMLSGISPLMDDGCPTSRTSLENAKCIFGPFLPRLEFGRSSTDGGWQSQMAARRKRIVLHCF